MVAESFKGQLAELAREASEHALENLFGLATVEHLEGILEERKGAALLKLDNVLVADQFLRLTARGEHRCGLRTLAGRASKGQGEQREQNRQTHCYF